ncbi:hypothetical protein [Culicoidibacter larvae]|uniref:Uncharacterized protein n=1 Tax=Culicoidibacter larvae TaxID=2579976 RepID=A0A5R8Q9L6_9FIRM|nr:hypothetical protein [Culicoidibacter larvae]TLG72113.1 hypothetical protein FEZ08_09790 [Culicoidibacter larvae]
MSRYLRTFFADNRLVLSISAIVLFVTTLLYTFLLCNMITYQSQNYSNYGGGFEGLMITMMIVFVLFVLLMLFILAPGTSLFITLRNFTGRSKLRYAMIRMSRISFFFGQLAAYLLISIGIIAVVGLGAFIGVTLGGQLLGTLDTMVEVLSGFLETPLSAMLWIVNSGLGWVTNFFFWATWIILYSTKSFRKIPRVGRIFLIIGMVIGYFIITMMINFVFATYLGYGSSTTSLMDMMFGYSSVYNSGYDLDYERIQIIAQFSQLIYNLIPLFGFGGIYMFLLAKRYEV